MTDEHKNGMGAEAHLGAKGKMIPGDPEVEKEYDAKQDRLQATIERNNQRQKNLAMQGLQMDPTNGLNIALSIMIERFFPAGTMERVDFDTEFEDRRGGMLSEAESALNMAKLQQGGLHIPGANGRYTPPKGNG